MTKPRILVTSAAGRTGAAAVQELLSLGFPVRAFVRRDDARAADLRAQGAEVFVGNLFDYRDLQAALVDVQRAYHCPPFAPNQLHGSMLFALAAEEAKLEVVALMSGWNPHRSHPSLLTREQWIANNIFRWMPSVDFVHVNPGLFGVMYLLGLPAIAHFGAFLAPFGEGLNAPPSNEDIGSLAAHVLAAPDGHIGRCYRPTGPTLIAPQDIAGILSKVLDRTVTYRDVPFSMFAKAAKVSGFPTFEIANMKRYAEELREGAYAVGAPTDHVERVTGRKPEDFETLARRYVANPELIAPGLQIGTKLGATWDLMKMLVTRPPDLERFEREHGQPALVEPLLAHESDTWRAAAERYELSLLGRVATIDAARPIAVSSGSPLPATP
ncbi:MAG: NmrA family NAD(P)-binding protein [Deltaproteobacteria bacterium]|nr:NmrA family NAD(P)-binding protein [Deltaproteobacteria bacterium]